MREPLPSAGIGVFLRNRALIAGDEMPADATPPATARLQGNMGR